MVLSLQHPLHVIITTGRGLDRSCSTPIIPIAGAFLLLDFVPGPVEQNQDHGRETHGIDKNLREGGWVRVRGEERGNLRVWVKVYVLKMCKSCM